MKSIKIETKEWTIGKPGTKESQVASADVTDVAALLAVMLRAEEMANDLVIDLRSDEASEHCSAAARDMADAISNLRRARRAASRNGTEASE